MEVIDPSAPPTADVLTRTVERLSTATTLAEVTEAVAEAVRALTGADGATFVLREDGQCYYVDENAIGPLWKGSKFPLGSCVSGWAMLNKSTVMIPDIYVDPRVPHDAYRPTFVSSLAMAPVRSADPIGAIGAYWADNHVATEYEMHHLEVLANSAAVALENMELRGAIRRRSDERDHFAARADELESAMHSLVHDLRNPLGAILGFAELIADAAPGDAAATYASAILRSGERMSDQIDRMLSIYRITSRPIEPERLDLSAVGRRVATDLLVQARDRDVEIDVEDGLEVVADPVLTQLMLENLLGNAVKYTGKVPHARIGLARRGTVGRFGTFVVSDNGAGFDPADAGKLFHPMTRLHAQDDFPGTGLGLASVARIVDLHGGDVYAEGRPAAGASFSFSLPIPA